MERDFEIDIRKILPIKLINLSKIWTKNKEQTFTISNPLTLYIYERFKNSKQKMKIKKTVFILLFFVGSFIKNEIIKKLFNNLFTLYSSLFFINFYHHNCINLYIQWVKLRQQRWFSLVLQVLVKAACFLDSWQTNLMRIFQQL